MEVENLKFSIGQLVFAKVNGYFQKLAVVLEILKNTSKVVFFNSTQHSVLGFKKLTNIMHGDAIVSRYVNKNIGFTKAYHEMMLVLTGVIGLQSNIVTPTPIPPTSPTPPPPPSSSKNKKKNTEKTKKETTKNPQF